MKEFNKEITDKLNHLSITLNTLDYNAKPKDIPPKPKQTFLQKLFSLGDSSYEWEVMETKSYNKFLKDHGYIVGKKINCRLGDLINVILKDIDENSFEENQEDEKSSN